MTTKAKREIWLSENEYGRKGAANHFEICSKHHSKAAASKAARECQKSSGIKHRVRKEKT